MKSTTSYRLKLIGAFAAVYIIWGSTYLAIHYAIETIPPLLMAGSRFVTAGLILFVFARIRGAELPSLSDVKKSSLIGALLLLGGNGMVVLAEQTVPSGLTALIIATEPLMIVLLGWSLPGGIRPSGRTAFGLFLGFAGMIFLIGPLSLSGNLDVDLTGAMLVVGASFSWASGSLYASRVRTESHPLMAAAIQMLVGGVLLFLAGAVRGEMNNFTLSTVSATSLFSVVYLLVFGSLVGFTSYSWLLREVKPSLAATYAYVNPIVAVFLGWLIAGELITQRTVIAAVVILTGVLLILTRKKEDLPPSVIEEP